MRKRRDSISVERLEPRMMLAGDPVISEFMAINDSTLADGDGDFPDWIEVHNPGEGPLDLGGWYLTDSQTNLSKWQFPSVEIPSGGYLTVFASDKATPPAGELHTNFKLSGDGEYLALVMPDGQTVTTEFAPYPAQIADVSFGLGVEATTTTRVAADGPLRVLVPSDGTLGQSWTEQAFDDSLWTAGSGGVGFDLDNDFDSLIGSDVQGQMQGINPSAYLRTEFDVADASSVNALSLGVQYDDGFVAYLNGQQVASRNAVSQTISPETGLVSYWGFEDSLEDSASDFLNNSGLAEDDLTARGGTARYDTGMVGQALAIGVQGGDLTDLSAPLSPDVQLPGTYAIEAWIKPAKLTDTWQRLTLNWGDGQFAYHFAIRNNSGLSNAVSLFHGQADGTQRNVDGGTVVANEWQYIAGVADGEFLRVYLNGEEVASTPYDGSIFTSSSEGLGVADSFSSLSGIKFNGLLDELAMWEVPLSAEQVRAHYEAGASGYGLATTVVSDEVMWNSPALGDRADADAVTVESIDLSPFADLIQPGTNVLAIQGLNSSADDRDFLIRAELTTSQIAVQTDAQRFFTTPTPGAPNGTGTSDLGPIITNVAHEQLPPQGIVVTPLITSSSLSQTLVPTDDALAEDWTDPDYVLGSNGESWTALASGGVGFDLDGDYDALIGTDVQAAAFGNNASTFIRTEFDVADPSALDRLNLSLKYDDGVVVYLNGEPIVTRNSPAGDGTAPDTGLTTYYDFNGSITDNADQYTNFAGTAADDLTAFAAVGAVNVAYEPGVVGQAVRISRAAGDATVLQAADSDDLDLTASWTIEAFVKPDLSNTGEWDRFATKWFNGSNQWHWAFRFGNNGQDLFINGAQKINAGGTGTVPLGQWTHVAWTGDPNEGMKLWQNGVVIATSSYQAIIPGTDPFRLGNFSADAGNAALQFSGLIDEFAIWNRALSAEELLAHAMAGAEGYGLTPVGGATDALAWNSAAETDRPDSEATVAEEIDITNFRSLLRAGTNVLAIQGLNSDASDRDMLIAAELTAESGSVTDGPLRVTAEVAEAFNGIDQVTMTYRAMFEAEQQTEMFDDGTNGDQVAGDGVYTGLIPSSIAGPGEMIRYYVAASDNVSVSSRAPLFQDPNNSAEYFGLVVDDPSIDTELPVLHRFMQNPGAAENRGGTRGSVSYNGEFYDNVFIRMRGQTSANWPKKSYKIDFNDGDHFLVAPGVPRKEEININTTYTDKSYLRGVLAYEVFRDTGSPYSLSFPLRMQQNGEFFSVAQFVEQVDTDYLRRNGLDDDGALYKPNGNNLTGSATSGVAKKNRRDEDFSDLQAFINGIGQSDGSAALNNFIFDNVNLPGQINYMVANIINQNIDRTVKNYYVYRDTTGNGEWQMLPWDVDLTFGPDALNTDVVKANFDSAPDHTSYPFLGGSQFPFRGLWNRFLDVIYKNDTTREMFLRRLRTAMDEQLQPPGTPTEELLFEARIDELVAALGPDVLLDKARWGGNAHFGATDPSLLQETDELKTAYFALRRPHLYVTHTASSEPPVPITTVLQSGAAATAFVPIDETLGTTWTEVGFNDQDWLAGTSGVGYDENTTYRSLLGIDLRSTAFPADKRIDTNGDATSENDSAYVRIPFDVTDPNVLTELKLRMKYDDGFVAYINGTEVASAFAPGRDGDGGTLAWNSPATANYADGQALVFRDFDISAFGGPGGILTTGVNMLAIQMLNDDTNGTGTSSDMLVMPEIVNGQPAPPSGASVGIPAEQLAAPPINFGAIDFNPASGNQDEEFIELINPGTTAVDLSGWQLTGGVQMTLQAGVVIPAGGSLYVSPDVATFRARASGPSGGQGLFVQGNYAGHISNFGETIQLVAPDTTVVATITTPNDPSPVQEFLRVTEINYNPPGVGDAAEFIELRNTSSGAQAVTLDLAGVSFTDGIDFNFTTSAVTSLLPGARLLIVRDQAAFEARYGSGLGSIIAGEFAGDTALNNGSETIKIEDADNSTVLEFTYDDDWYKETDGEGFTLVIGSEVGPAESWESRGGWRSSAAIGGSPGETDPQARAGDFNGDLSTNRADVVKLVENFGRTTDSYRTRGDTNLDGATSLVDLAMVQANFGEGVAAAPSAQANSQLEAVDAIFTGFSRETEQRVVFSSRVRRPIRAQHRPMMSEPDPSSDSATALSRPDRSHSPLQLRARRRQLRSLQQADGEDFT